MKVLIVHPCKGFYGGAEEVVVQLTNYLHNNGHELRIVLKSAPTEMESKLEEIISSWYIGNSHSWKGFRYLTRGLTRWADIINVHNFPATLATFPTKKPIVYLCNEPAELFTNWWRKPIEAFNRWWVKKSGMKVIVADQVNAKRFFDIYGVVPTIIPYGVDYDFWSQGHATLDKENFDFTMLQVGTITPYKNQLESIKVLETIKYAQLLLVGSKSDKRYADELFSYILTHKLIERVKFIDHVSHEELRNLYKSCSLLLHPIRGQGGWLVPFEAMCAGLPVITTTDFSAFFEIDLNNLGTVAGPDDMASWVLDGAYKELDTETIKKWVKENLTWEKFGESIKGVFKDAINRER